MILELKRLHISSFATIGELSIDGAFECYICEDVVREVKGRPVEEWKIAGDTAIPYGRYSIDITMSARFHVLLPLLINVPGYSGIRIHPGNTTANTDGCLLPGRTWRGASVGESRLAFNQLFAKLRAAKALGMPIEIEIT